jgi:hypothetical protein
MRQLIRFRCTDTDQQVQHEVVDDDLLEIAAIEA